MPMPRPLPVQPAQTSQPLRFLRRLCCSRCRCRRRLPALNYRLPVTGRRPQRVACSFTTQSPPCIAPCDAPSPPLSRTRWGTAPHSPPPVTVVLPPRPNQPGRLPSPVYYQVNDDTALIFPAAAQSMACTMSARSIFGGRRRPAGFVVCPLPTFKDQMWQCTQLLALPFP